MFQELSQRSKEEDMLKILERWKGEEKERQKAQMEETRLIFLKEAKELSAKNTFLQSVRNGKHFLLEQRAGKKAQGFMVPVGCNGIIQF